MSEPVSVARQATFNTELLDHPGSDKITRGNIELPVVTDSWSSQPTHVVEPGPHNIQHGRDTQRNAATKLLKPTHSLSELDILSDVGIAGDDSESDAPPPFKSSLSSSTRQKIRKEPRITVPNIKFDSEEPTIAEERTQEFLSQRSNLRSTESIPTGHFSQKVKRPKSVEGLVERVEPNKFDGKPQSRQFEDVKVARVQPAKFAFGDSNHQNENFPDKDPHESIKDIPVDKSNEQRISEKYHLESSFYESDWQPKSKKQSATINKSSFLAKTLEEDKNAISMTYKNDVKPSCQPNLNKGKRWAQDSRSSADNKSPPLLIAPGSQSRSQSPAKLHCLEVEAYDTDKTINSDWNNDDSVSGIPKVTKFQIDENKKTYPFVARDSKMSNMAVTDGYDEYASETFEEVLQERNAMIKTERTYQKRIKQLEEELKGMISTCQILSNENKDLRAELDNVKSGDGTQNTESESSGDLKAKNEKLELVNKGLLDANEKLSQRLKDSEKKTPRGNDGIFVENTKLKNKNAELEKMIQELRNEIQNNDVKAKRAKTPLVESEDSKKENQILTVKVKKLEGENKSLSETLEAKRKEVNELLHAMGNESTSEVELAQSKEQLDLAMEGLEKVKCEVDELKQVLSESDDTKDKLKSTIIQKESEMKKFKVEQENKDRLINDLRVGLEKARQESNKQQQNAQLTKDMERDVTALKSRIGSLKAEIESSLSENHRLKFEREESSRIIEKLRQENFNSSEAVAESKRYFRKWETERDAKNKFEVDIQKKDEEIQTLDSRLREAGHKMSIFHSRLRTLEDEKTKFNGTHFHELEANLKISRDENKKLRQMLVERNIELTNKKTEDRQIDNRIQMLERKQIDSDVKVKQLAGWVSSNEPSQGPSPGTSGNMNPEPRGVQGRVQNPQRPRATISLTVNTNPAARVSSDQNLPNNRQHHIHPNSSQHQVQPNNQQHQIHPSNQQRVTGGNIQSKKMGAKSKKNSMTPPPGWQQKRGSGEPVHTPLSLPSILDSQSLTPPPPGRDGGGSGYFQMYQEKMKRMKDRSPTGQRKIAGV